MMVKKRHKISINSFVVGAVVIGMGWMESFGAGPDFTNGGVIPSDAPNDFTLGPIGADGWMHAQSQTTYGAVQIYVKEVNPGSPSDGVLQEGDVILGARGQMFRENAREELAAAIGIAESNAGGGNLSLIRWRNGSQSNVVVRLPVLGSYSLTAPYDCPKSSEILRRGAAVLHSRVSPESYRGSGLIPDCLNVLALLATGEVNYRPAIKKEVGRLAAQFVSFSRETWFEGYRLMMLAEYQLATGDNTFRSEMERIALRAAEGQSDVGSWGHRYTPPGSPRLTGYGALNAAAIPLGIGLELSRRAGLSDPRIVEAVRRHAEFLRDMVGKGSIPYGDHPPNQGRFDDNGKCGMAAVLFDLLNDAEATRFMARTGTGSYGPVRELGHTGNFTNMTWAIPGIARLGPEATGAWMGIYGGWNFDFTRRWDWKFLHQGPSNPKKDKFDGWDVTGAFLLAYAMPLKKIYLTGKKPSAAPQATRAEAAQLIADGEHVLIFKGPGGTEANFDGLTDDELYAKVGNWSSAVRNRAIRGLRRRFGSPQQRLVTMLETGDLYEKHGACQALSSYGSRSAFAVEPLRRALDSSDLWLRVLASEALARIGRSAKATVPKILQLMAKGKSPSDPRAFESRMLADVLFKKMDSNVVREVMAEVDVSLAVAAFREGIHHLDGATASLMPRYYGLLSQEVLEEVMPDIYDATVEYADSGVMFADAVRVNGLQFLTDRGIREGMIGIAIYLKDQNVRGIGSRTQTLIGMLESYGAHAKEVIPQLEEAARNLESMNPGFGVGPSAELIRAEIEVIRARTNLPPLTSLFASDSVSFDEWVKKFVSNPSLRKLADDPDGDGVSNGVENLLGTDPGRADSHGGVRYQHRTVVGELAGRNTTEAVEVVSLEHFQNEAFSNDLELRYMWTTDMKNYFESGQSNGRTRAHIIPFRHAPGVGKTQAVVRYEGEEPSRIWFRVGVRRK